MQKGCININTKDIFKVTSKKKDIFKAGHEIYWASNN